MPDNVLGLEATGEVTSADYKETLAPAIRELREKHGKVRLLVLLGDEFTGFTAGALWQDEKLLDTNFSSFEKVAVVTESGPVRGAMHLFGWMIPGAVRLFGTDERDEAKAWVSS
ncbi:MAG TPA: STAS/SEC14 domain-containing protein [Candidatus Limnocylindrales bacterium]